MGPKIVLCRDDPLVGVRLKEKVPAEPVAILVHARRGDGWRGKAIGEDVATVPRSREGHGDGAQPIARRRSDLQDRHIDHWILERYSHDRRVIGDWPVIRYDERVELVGRIASLAVVKDVMGRRQVASRTETPARAHKGDLELVSARPDRPDSENATDRV